MDVSCETIKRLKIYQNLLEVWQKKVNLISSSTLSHSWKRHFEDSLQLLSYLPDKGFSLIDLGSGAGFPGLVLAIACPLTITVTLVESDLKKCLFLETVSRETNTPITLLRERVESLDTQAIQGDIITARGLASLSLLLEYACPLMKENSKALFLKGKDAKKEIEAAKKKWEFDLEIFPSMTDSAGRILEIKSPKRIESHG